MILLDVSLQLVEYSFNLFFFFLILFHFFLSGPFTLDELLCFALVLINFGLQLLDQALGLLNFFILGFDIIVKFLDF